MYKGLVSLAAVLSSSVLFANAGPITACPNLNEINSIVHSEGSTNTIAPRKLYSMQKLVQDSSGQWFSIFVGPIKASRSDSAFYLADYILSRSAQEGHLEFHNCQSASKIDPLSASKIDPSAIDRMQNIDTVNFLF